MIYFDIIIYILSALLGMSGFNLIRNNHHINKNYHINHVVVIVANRIIGLVQICTAVIMVLIIVKG